MIYSAVAFKYSKALFNVAKKLNKLEDYKKQLSVLSQLYDNLYVFLNNQAIKPQRRTEVLVSVLKEVFGNVDEPFQKFLFLVVYNKRTKLIKQIASYYSHISLEDSGYVPVEITSASELTSEERSLIVQFVEKYTNRKPVFEETIDHNLIAGAVIEFAGKKFDVSVRGRLESVARNVLIRKG